MEYILPAEVLRIAWTSIWVSTTSICLATLFSLPLAFLIATQKFRGKKTLITILHTLMFLPTVVVGLLVYSFLCQRGLLGNWGLLYTPYAMIIGQFILAFPLITALTIQAIASADARIAQTALTLGATRWQCLLLLVGELRLPIIASVIAGFGRVFSEVGVSMMLGGNIRNYTRNLTTAIALETARGEFSLGLVLGVILLACALGINLIFRLLYKRT